MTKKQARQLKKIITPLLLAAAAFVYTAVGDGWDLSHLQKTSILGDKVTITFGELSETFTPTSTPGANESERETATVKRVVDGDTIVLTDGRKVRYIGIDTPETVHPNKPAGCFGQQASDKNKQLVTGKKVQLEKDVSDTDRYGRLLRYVYLDGQMVNEILLEEGYATVSTYPPDVKYQSKFQKLEQEARAQGLGLWGADCNN